MFSAFDKADKQELYVHSLEIRWLKRWTNLSIWGLQVGYCPHPVKAYRTIYIIYTYKNLMPHFKGSTKLYHSYHPTDTDRVRAVPK